MSKKNQKKQEDVQLLKRQLDQMNKQMDLLQDEIRAERSTGLPDENELSRQLERDQRQLDKVKKKMEKVKAHIKKRKKEIQLWKDNFARIQDDQKVDSLKQLTNEISWRAADIAAKEAEVAALYLAKTSAEGVIEATKIRQFVVKAGVDKKEPDEDPRLLALARDQQEIRTKLADIAGITKKTK